MTPSTTNVDERDQWRAKINRALAELRPSDLSHLQAPAVEESDLPESIAEV